jgi:hypothetical protein
MPKKAASGKKVAPAPAAARTGAKAVKKVQNPLFESNKRNFGIGEFGRRARHETEALASEEACGCRLHFGGPSWRFAFSHARLFDF